MTFKNKIDDLFTEMVKKSLEERKSVKDEDASNDKSDDGEGMDKVDPKAVKKKFKDRKDKDLDNDGDTDSSDEYLHKRRKAISKAVNEFKKKVNESVELEEESKTIEKVREITDKKQAMKIDGVMVDMFTASAITQIYDKVNDANKKKMDGLKITKLADLAMKMMKREEVEEELELDEAKNYEYKDGKVHISKKDFRKVHKDYKNATKGKERMMVLDPKTQATVSAPVVFTESSFKEKFKRTLSRRFAESKIEESDVAERHNELKSMPPVELMKLYQKHYDESDLDKVKNMDKDELISKIIKAENGED